MEIHPKIKKLIRQFVKCIVDKNNKTIIVLDLNGIDITDILDCLEIIDGKYVLQGWTIYNKRGENIE